MNAPREAGRRTSWTENFGALAESAPFTPLPWLRAWLAVCGLAAIWLVGTVLLVRALSGALAQPLGAMLMFALTGLGALAALGARMARPATRGATYWLPGLGLLLMAAAISLCGGSALGLGGIWLLVVAEEAAAWRWLRGAHPRAATGTRAPRKPAARPERLATTTPGDLADEMTQQLVRRASAAGGDVLAGFLRASFQPRQRTTIVHVAFCPPFAAVPTIVCRQVDGPTTRIKLGTAMTYGLRIECTLAETTDRAARALLEFSAEAP